VDGLFAFRQQVIFPSQTTAQLASEQTFKYFVLAHL